MNKLAFARRLTVTFLTLLKVLSAPKRLDTHLKPIKSSSAWTAHSPTTPSSADSAFLKLTMRDTILLKHILGKDVVIVATTRCSTPKDSAQLILKKLRRSIYLQTFESYLLNKLPFCFSLVFGCKIDRRHTALTLSS